MHLSSAAAALFPKGDHDQMAPWWDKLVSYADLTTALRQAAFLAQVGHECAGFTRWEENLSYRTPQRLCKVWPTRFRMPRHFEVGWDVFEDGKRNPFNYIRNPQRLANFVYAGRMGNGDEKSEDGWTYRGRGAIMNTGKRQYHLLTLNLGDHFGVSFVREPDLLKEPKYGLLAAGDFWKQNNLNDLADKGELRTITRKVSGAYTNHDDRLEIYQRATGLLLRDRVV